ncbi:uncharacterized protein DFL_005192 [Arthrobotrys flagrans]|uniref:Peptidase S8/S53 domain-containing protein n=1 Tax=Arthrobotrys flagrans TaxID=97331 RepID=A0A437A718_ARTFL|nr:hypothetical protein DFL_005192 [Arthrobotrys flagrans]
MKSIAVISSYLLLCALPFTFAAPTASRSQTDLQGNEPQDDFLFILAEHEKRSVGEVIDEMGLDHTKATTFGIHMRGFSISLPESHAHDIASLESIAFMQKNNKRSGPVANWNLKSRDMTSSASFALSKRQANTLVEQTTAPWGLERISRKEIIELGDRKVEDLFFKYHFDRLSGDGVDVYSIDSGINIDHVDFNGRAKMIFTAFGDDGKDEHGHGTHTAGTIGSLTYGVAKNVNIFGCKVLGKDNFGSDAGIIAGVDAAFASHMKRKDQPGFKGSVINMSLGGPDFLPALSDLLRRALNAGMHVVVAAGNENSDACSSDPGRLSTQIPIINVGAIEITDNRWVHSNFGKCVTLHAPGVGIVSTWHTGPRTVMALDGTSMASPHVAGVVADLLAKNPALKLDPKGMKELLLSKSQKGGVKGIEKVIPGGDFLLNTGMGDMLPGEASNTTM